MKTIRLSLALLTIILFASCNTFQKKKTTVITETATKEISITETNEEAMPPTPEPVPKSIQFVPPLLDKEAQTHQRIIASDLDCYTIAASPLSESKTIVADHVYSTVESPRRIPIRKVQNTEQYPNFTENKFQIATDNPLSTFSIDVDAASYSNMRRFINQGQIPPTDALRIEEMINYFSYNYKQPTGSDPVNIATEVGTCPWNENHRLVKIGLKAKDIPSDKLSKSNFVFLIDTSGSMQGGNRIDLVKASLRLLLNNLREEDRVAIVTYAGTAQLLMSSTSGADKQRIRETINGIQVGGWTNGGSGMQLAYDIARKNFIKDGNNRIIMCSDGDFNVGHQSENDLKSLVEKERKSGVFLSMLGYGMGNYKDNKMQTLAQAGNGNHAYIDNLQEANKVLVNEFGATMYTVAKDVKLQIEFNPAKVQAYRLVGYETRLLNKEDFNNDAIDAGEMGAGHTVAALYEVVPTGVKSNFIGSVAPLKYQKEIVTDNLFSSSSELLTVKLRYKEPDGNTSKLISKTLIDSQRNNVSEDFKFAVSVAMFGQLIKESDYMGDANFDQVIALANQGLSNDKHGYRREFIRLVETTKGLF